MSGHVTSHHESHRRWKSSEDAFFCKKCVLRDLRPDLRGTHLTPSPAYELSSNGIGHSWSAWSPVFPSDTVVPGQHRGPRGPHFPRGGGQSGRHRLPGPDQRIPRRDESCLSSERVFWPEDGQCHTLLTKVSAESSVSVKW